MTEQRPLSTAWIAVALLVGGALLVAYPLLVQPIFKVVAINILISIILAMSFNLLYGVTGLFSFGQAAFFGLGAYGTALFLNHSDIGFAAAVGATLLIVGLVGLAVGAMLVGLGRISFIMLTFAVAELFDFAAKHLPDITQGETGLIVDIPASLNIVTNATNVYYVTLVATVLTIGALAALTSSSFGLVLRAIQENTLRVQLVGVNVWRYRLVSFTIAAVVAGLAGAFAAIANQVINPSVFGWFISADALIITLVGGARYFAGPIVGAVIFGLVGFYAGRLGTNNIILNGSIFLAIVILAPQGVTAVAVAAWRKAGQVLASVSKVFRRKARVERCARVS